MHNPSNHLSVFTDDTTSQVPQVMLSMGVFNYTRLIESLAFLALMTNGTEGLLYAPGGCVAAGTIYSLWEMLPMMKGKDGKTYPLHRLDDGAVANMQWPLQMLWEYAKFRNRMENTFLVSDDTHTIPLVYGALRALHEYRVASIKDSITKNGPHFGSATSWWKDDWSSDVEGWPSRWQFTEFPWSPLPKDDPDFYAPSVAVWEAAQKEGTNAR